MIDSSIFSLIASTRRPISTKLSYTEHPSAIRVARVNSSQERRQVESTVELVDSCYFHYLMQGSVKDHYKGSFLALNLRRE
jgi:hypothetical protein